MRQIQHMPRGSVWNLVQQVADKGEAPMPVALQLIQEYLYCVDGVITPIQQPETEEQQALVGKAFTLAYDAFSKYHY